MYKIKKIIHKIHPFHFSFETTHGKESLTFLFHATAIREKGLLIECFSKANIEPFRYSDINKRNLEKSIKDYLETLLKSTLIELSKFYSNENECIELNFFLTPENFKNLKK